MLKAFLNFFKEPAPKPLIKDRHEIEKKYKHYQWRLLYSLYLGYVISYIGRKNLSMAMPEMMQCFHVTKVEMGVILSAFTSSYAVGKFVNGVLADKANVRTFYSSALVLAGLCLFAFAWVANFSFIPVTMLLSFLAFIWGAGAWFQSMTFPPIAKSLSYWFSKRTRGSKWSIMSTAHQTGVFAGTYIAAFLIQQGFGWQSAFYVPGAISILGGFWLYNRLRDKPSTEGLPSVEEYEQGLEGYDAESGDVDNKSSGADDSNRVSEEKGEKLTYVQMLVKYILCNPLVWILTLAFLFIYVVRQASEDWLVTFFQEVRGNEKVFAGHKLMSYTLAGAAGTVFAGVISEKCFKGKRTPVNLLFLFGLLGSLFVFSRTTVSVSNEIFDFIYVGLIGFFVAGLQNLVGLQIVEFCAKNVASAANGFAGTMSYVGSTIAGVGTGFMSEKFGWNGAFTFWMAATVAAILLVLLLIPFEVRHERNRV